MTPFLAFVILITCFVAIVSGLAMLGIALTHEGSASEKLIGFLLAGGGFAVLNIVFS